MFPFQKVKRLAKPVWASAAQGHRSRLSTSGVYVAGPSGRKGANGFDLASSISDAIPADIDTPEN